MAKNLDIIRDDVLSPKERNMFSQEIDRIIDAHKQNRQELNRLVFDCTAALTESEDAQMQLANKSGVSRFVGMFTGSNKRLQDAINYNNAQWQWAAQRALQKLAEQNLITIEVIAAVDNKLNTYRQQTDAQFSDIYKVLKKFLRHTGNKFFQIDAQLEELEHRVDKLEHNDRLVRWSKTIKYQELDGEEYKELNRAGKIVCLARDFYDLTKDTERSADDFMILQDTMEKIGLNPDEEVEYYGIIKEIANSEILKQKFFGYWTIPSMADPSYAISLGTIQKLTALETDEKYIVNTVQHQLAKHDIDVATEAIRDDITLEYLAQFDITNPYIKIEAFDLVKDLLYNLEQAETMALVPVEEEQPVAEEIQEETQEDTTDLDAAEQLFLDYKLDEAFVVFTKLAEKGNGRAMYFLSEYYRNGYGSIKANAEEAKTWAQKGAQAGDVFAEIRSTYYVANKKEKDEAFRKHFTTLLPMAQADDVIAQYELAVLYELGLGVKKDVEKAAQLYDKSVENNYWPAAML